MGPAVFLDLATFDCSAAPSFRSYWHALKLRSEFHARLGGERGSGGGGGAERSAIVVVNRNGCNGGPYCKSARKVKWQASIEDALVGRFDGREVGGVGLEVRIFDGRGPIVEQARLFRRALVVTGPHGACAQPSSMYLASPPSLPYPPASPTSSPAAPSRLLHFSLSTVTQNTRSSGAGEANYIFCQKHTAVIEYLMGPSRLNSAL